MDCERAQILLSDYLGGALPGSDLAEVAAHLRDCRPCSAGAEGLRETLALLRNLPPVKAPPELLERIREGIVQERADRPLWKRLFLPAHVKIPLEAAAAVLLFLLVYAAQKEQPPKEAPPRPTTERGSALSARDEKENARVPPAAAPPAKPSLPVVPAQRVSTDAGKIEPPPVPGEEAGKSAPARLFAAPPSRHLRPVPSGREVTIEVSRENRLGLEERIVESVLGLGGTAIPHPARPGAGENGALPNLVRVEVPSDSAEKFFAELMKLGDLPPEGMPGWADFPAGPSPGVVIYTVRIRVR